MKKIFLYGIEYYIKKDNDSNRIEEGENDFIIQFNNLYGNRDILTVVFTQSLNKKTEERKTELFKDLNNENTEIIDVFTKFYVIKLEK